jgi:hypothetical protein
LLPAKRINQSESYSDGEAGTNPPESFSRVFAALRSAFTTTLPGRIMQAKWLGAKTTGGSAMANNIL